MPSGLRWFAEHQPFTPIIETLRGLLMGTPVGTTASSPSPGASGSPWPASSGRSGSTTATRPPSRDLPGAGAASTLPRMLHVTNGDSAAEKLREAGLQGLVAPWRDILHEGPVPAGLDPAALREVRVRYLAEHGWAGEERVRADLEERDARLAQAVEGRDEIVLWFEPDLYDMLQLAQVLDRLPPDVANLVIVGEEEFTGVAQLALHELQAVFKGREVAGKARRVPVGEALVREGRAVWRALRNPEPARLAALVDGTPDLPALGEAVQRFLQQYPWCRSGLNRTERALLRAVEDGAATPLEAFEAHQRQEERPVHGRHDGARVPAPAARGAGRAAHQQASVRPHRRGARGAERAGAVAGPAGALARRRPSPARQAALVLGPRRRQARLTGVRRPASGPSRARPPPWTAAR